jgi:hypothetical protein
VIFIVTFIILRLRVKEIAADGLYIVGGEINASAEIVNSRIRRKKRAKKQHLPGKPHKCFTFCFNLLNLTEAEGLLRYFEYSDSDAQ